MIFIKTLRIRWGLMLAAAAACGLLWGIFVLAENIVQNKAVESMSWALANKVVVVDPGHGGPDGGGVSSSGVLEKDVTLVFGKKLARYLSQAGSAVILTRESDADLSSEGKSIRARKVEDLKNRVKLAEENRAAAYLSIHTNSFGTQWSGAQVFYAEGSEEGKALAECIQSEIARIINNTHRKAKTLSSYILRELDMPTVIVEVGFLSNPNEEKLLLDEHYQDRMSYAIYAGTVKYFAGERVLENVR